MNKNIVRRFLSIGSCSGASLNYDGSRVAFISNITGVPQLWSVPTEGGWPKQLTYFSERVGMVSASPGEDRLYFAMDQGGNERMQLFLMENEGFELPLTQDPDSIHIPGPWSPNGKTIAYASNTRSKADFDIYLMDLDTRKGEMVYKGSGHNAPVAWSPDGTKILFSQVYGNANNNLWVMDLASGKAQHLTPHEGNIRYRGINWQPDGIWLITDKGSDFLYIAMMDPKTGSMVEKHCYPWDVETLSVSSQGIAAYTVNEDGYSKLYIGETQKELPQGVVGGLSWSGDAKILAFTFTGPHHPADIWVCEDNGKNLRRITESTLAGIKRETLVKPELVRYPGYGGLEIPAYFYKPTGASGPVPVVIDVHGGPESQERPDFNPLIQLLLSRGIGVLAPNVRGSTGYGKEYSHLDDVEKRMDSVADLALAAKWLAETGRAPSERIAVMGGSYGGFMVLAALTNYPELWAAGIDIVGIANFETFLENTGPWRRKLREAEYGSLEANQDFLREISPIHKVGNITAPLLVIHGTNDPRVPVGEAEQIVASLKERNADVEYLCFDDEGHGIVKHTNKIISWDAMVKFLERTLGN